MRSYLVGAIIQALFFTELFPVGECLPLFDFFSDPDDLEFGSRCMSSTCFLLSSFIWKRV